MNWLQFFKNAGIPDAAANQYNQSFIKNRIQQSHLADLDKNTLSELGVRAIGDQLAILKTIKKGSHSSTSVSRGQRVKIEAPDSSSSSIGSGDMSMASFHRKGRPPPDSQEIYHIKMPQGTTSRTQQILRRAQMLHSKGLVRGLTGVRQGGRPVSPIDKTSIAARNTNQRGTVRVIQQHLGGGPRVSYASRTMTVTVPERQQKQRISFGNESEARSTRFANNKPIEKVISSSRVMKRIERPGTSRTNIQQRISYTNGRNPRVQMVEEEYDGEEEVIYEDAESGEQLYMDDDGSLVEYVDQPQRKKKNIFSRITM